MPAAAVIQNPQALSGFIGRKGSVGGLVSPKLNTPGSTRGVLWKRPNLRALGADRTVGVGVISVDINRNTESEGIQLG